jgi:hypothetical protein
LEQNRIITAVLPQWLISSHNGGEALLEQLFRRPLGREPGIQHRALFLDSGFAPKRARPGMTVLEEPEVSPCGHGGHADFP